MKYHDSKYHIEWLPFEYLGGYCEFSWAIVNVYGETCRKDGITIRFNDKIPAQKYCDKINECSDGGIVTNFT